MASQTFTSSDTWEAPGGVTSVDVTDLTDYKNAGNVISSRIYQEGT